MKKRFVFHDTNTGKSWCFDVTGNENLGEMETEYMRDNLIDDSHNYNGEDLEDTYGVHDVAFDENTDILGFFSYEVSENKYSELMEKWKDIFTKRGYTCSDIYVS